MSTEPSIEDADIRYDWSKAIISAMIKFSHPLSGRFEYLVHIDRPKLLNPVKEGHWTTLQRQTLHEIAIPFSSEPENYRLSLIHNGSVLQTRQANLSFQVVNPVHALIQTGRRLTPDQKIQLLSIHRDEYGDIDDVQLNNSWPILRFVKAARKSKDPLPAWAVTDSSFRFKVIYAGAVKTALIYPEVAREQGFSGIGKVPIFTEGDGERDYAYAQWVRSGDHVLMKMFLPENSPQSYWDLHPDDMYPVYFSRRELRFYAKRGYPSSEEMDLLDLVEIGFQNSLPCEVYPSEQHDLRYTLKPHYWVDKRYFIARIFRDRYEVRKPDAEFYRRAVDDFIRRSDGERELVSKFLDDGHLRQALERFGEFLRSSHIAQRTLSRVINRFIDQALLWSDDIEHEYLHLDRLLVLLAAVLRFRAYYPQLTDRIEEIVPNEQLSDMVDVADRIAPEMLKWALYWVESFAIHAIS